MLGFADGINSDHAEDYSEDDPICASGHPSASTTSADDGYVNFDTAARTCLSTSTTTQLDEPLLNVVAHSGITTLMATYLS